MNILVVSQYYYPEPFRINEICEELVKRGHEVTVLTGLPNYPDGKVFSNYEDGHFEEFINGVKILRCKNRPRKKGAANLFLNYLSFWFKANHKIKKLPNNFDIVYSYQLSPITSCIPACWYSKKYHKPHIIYCLDIWPESIIENISSKSLLYKSITWLSKKIYRSADIICVTSPSFVDYLSKLISWPKDRFIYIPQHARDIKPIPKEQSKNVLNILFTGNIGASQNLDVLIDAISQTTDDKGIRVTIVGSGSDLERIKEKVRCKGLSDIVSFEGRQPKEKMPYYYSIADFCFLSLRDEGAVSWTIPGKLQEYMSAGKPILAAINGDARFVVEEANCGVCVNYDDSHQLASVIFEFSKNKRKLSKFGKHSRDYYLNHFTLNSHVDALELVLTQVSNSHT